jgi:capsular exopolysaccharide synthesis family protein
VVIAFVLELAEDTVQNPDDVAQMLGVPLLGTVPVLPALSPDVLKHAPERARHRVVTAGEVDSRTLEMMNLIGVALRDGENGALPRRILVTSATPQEGKSTVAANLAAALARLETKVLLVDSDLRHPTLDKFFAVRAASGIGDAAGRGAPLDEAVCPTSVPGLSLLPVGRMPGNPLKLIKSAYFRDQIDALTERFDVILFDSPPITLVADSMALAPLTQGIVLVVRHGHGSRWRLQKMVGQLERLRVPVLGFVYDGYVPKDHRYYTSYYGSSGAKHTSRTRAEKQTVGRSS